MRPEGVATLAMNKLRSQRQGARLALNVDATLQIASGKTTKSVVRNLSADGCTIEMGRSRLEPDTTVQLFLEGFEALEGSVRWVRDGRAGIRFARPLHAAVLDHLAERPRRYPRR